MKFMCLGYGQESNWDALSKREQDAFIDECFAYDEELLWEGHWVDGGQALQGSRTAKTLRWKNGKVLVTDGPFAETKEQLGGFGVLQARDIDHAVALISKHPGLRYGGPFEIRPVDEESLKRRMAADAEWRKTGPVPPPNPDAVKFASLGYVPGGDWGSISQSDQDTMMNECITFDETRRKEGRWLGGIALQGVQTAKTLRSRGGKVVVTDGPYAESKEWLGGAVILGLKDMSHALELMVRHPALRFGVTIEIRPIDEQMNARWEARLAKFDRNRK